MLATAYQDVTGRKPGYTVQTDSRGYSASGRRRSRPTKSYDLSRGKVVFADGEWVSFVERIFEALGIDRVAWRDVVHAIREEKWGLGRKK